MSQLCVFKKYRNIFGLPNQGLHKYRIFNTALIDYIGSIMIAMLITWQFNIPLVLTTICVFIIGILFHIVFGVNTQVIKYLGLSCN